MGEMSKRVLLWLLLTALPAPALSADQAETAPRPQSASVLYAELRNLGLDPARVHQVRDAPIDQEDIHILLSEGTLAFTESVQGRITGAFFEGDGEILLVPPNQVERSSLALFTGAAILEERFSTAYFRFNDDTFQRLQPYLRPAEDPQEFLSKWNAASRSLAESDALALLESFTYLAPRQGAGAGPPRLLHARLAGLRLGTFDVVLNTNFSEQISLGQANYVEGVPFYNIWALFPMRSARESQGGKREAEGEIGRSTFRIPKYRITARVVPPHDLQAEAVLTLDIRQGGARTLIFELSRSLYVTSVTADGVPVEFIQNPALQGGELARRGDDLVAVVLPQPVEAGRSLELRFVYSGSVLSEAGGGLMYVGARGIWYPNRGPAMSEFDLEFRSPSAWTLVATGKRVSSESVGGEQISHWVSERPIPLAGFNLGKYVSSQAGTGNTVVESFAARGVESTFPQASAVVIPRLDTRGRRIERTVVPPPPPPTPAAQAKAVAERSARTVDFLSRRIGPFPYSSLALTQRPGRDSQGWPSLVFLTSYAFLTSGEKARLGLGEYEDILYRDLMQAHETAHQWWGDAVFWRSYRDMWLSEALANYSALLQLEAQDPAHFRIVMGRYRQELMAKSKDGLPLRDAGPVTIGRRLNSSLLSGAYEVVTYARGTWLIHMLRHLLRDAELESEGRAATGVPAEDRDARFYQVLRTLRERFDGREMSTQDVQKAFAEALPPSAHYEGRRSLEWFFDGWVNGTALPRFQLANVSFSRRSGKLVVSGKLLQRDAPATLVTSVPLYAAAAGKPVFLGRIFADGPETAFRLPAPAGAQKLLLDPYQTVLTRP